MKTKFIFIVLAAFGLLPICLVAQDTFSYNSLSIPDSLKKNAHAVVRLSQESFEVTEPGKAIYSVKKIVTILSKKSEERHLFIPYSPSEKLGKIKAKVYDALGKEVKKINAKDIKDYSSVSDFSIYEDDRFKYYEFFHTSYPYTIEYEYSKMYSGIQMYPSWYIQSYSLAVEKSSYTLVTPDNIQIGYKIFNHSLEPQKKVGNAQKKYYWEANNLMAAKPEAMGPPYREVMPWLHISPHQFEVAGYQGNMSDWKNFGHFMYQLNKGRDQLSPEMVAEVKALTAEAQSDSEKIAILYKYLQDNTRYVSVQLGIGGWQTFDAHYVESNKYGDCKALTNFMKSMLKEVGIKSYATLIRNGQNEFEIPEDCAYPGFNHVILNVPDEDIWLECTSTYSPPNYLGSGNADRNVLMITENGGELIRTPKLTAKDNQVHTKATIQLATSGAATIQEETVFSGALQETYRYYANIFSAEKQRESYLENSTLPSFNIEEWDLKADTKKPQVRRNCRLNVPKYASRAGKRFFIPLNLIHPFTNIPKSLKDRLRPIKIAKAYTMTDEFTFEIPDEYEVESYPKEPISMQSDFGAYDLTVRVEGQKVFYTRRLEVKSGEFPAEQYEALRDFYKDMAKKDGVKIVLNKKVLRP